MPLGLLVACVSINPAYDPVGEDSDAPSDTADSSVESSGSASDQDSTTSAATASESEAGPTSGGAEDTASGPSSPSETSTSGSAAATAATGGSASSSGDGTDETGTADTEAGVQPSELGQACAQSDGCDALGAGAQCCERAQCLGTCMVACESVADCPFAGMDCAHSYCLFPCDDSDDDCSDWPGFTCQHGGRLCEND